MSLFLIGSTAGTGKSTVCRLLKDRGYEADDTDDDGLARRQHTKTGYIHPKSSVKADQRTPEFLAQHIWSVPRQTIQEMTAKSKGRQVFLCGSLGNEDEVYDLFTRVFALYVDDKTLTHRLQTRTTNDWKKQPHELAQTLEHHHRVYDTHRSRGDIIVDATTPLEEVVEAILKQAEAADPTS
jgi:dephospho-CoA kinase